MKKRSLVNARLSDMCEKGEIWSLLQRLQEGKNGNGLFFSNIVTIVFNIPFGNHFYHLYNQKQFFGHFITMSEKEEIVENEAPNKNWMR